MNKNKFQVYTSEEIYTSRKKMIYTFRYIKNFSLKQASNYFYCLNKKYSDKLFKFINNVINNISYIQKITPEEAENKTIKFIILEKSSKHSYSLRYAAKGRAYRSKIANTRIKIYI